MKENKFIWVLLRAEETHELIAELDNETINRLAELLFNEVEDPDDPEAPKNVGEVAETIRREVVDGEDHSAYFSIYTLRRQELNVSENGETLLADPDFKVERGAVVYEAAHRIILGCDMSYALDPVGYFTRKVENPALQDIEWHEYKLS